MLLPIEFRRLEGYKGGSGLEPAFHAFILSSQTLPRFVRGFSCWGRAGGGSAVLAYAGRASPTSARSANRLATLVRPREAQRH